MLIKLALGNIRRSFRNYWAYFVSSAFSVFVLYLFLSVCFGNVTKVVVSFQSTAVLFGIGAFLTACFAAFFIWYSNSFFIKSRKKEFATYMLLGMSKRQTIRLSLMENIVILVMAFAAGIAAGILLNKLMIMLLLSIMDVTVSVPFEINGIAMAITGGFFAGVIAVVCLHGAFLLGRNSLIELINASKKAEKPMKASGWTWVIGALALGCLGFGYYLSVVHGLNIALWGPIVGLVCAGTALAFLGLATLYLHFSRKNEAKLYRGPRLITVTQLMHRYRGNVGALSTIAITTTVALCAVLCCCGLFGKTLDSSRTQRPFSMEIRAEQALMDLVEKAVDGQSDVKIVSKTPIDVVRVKAVGLEKNATYQIISQSQFNAIAQLLGWQERAALSSDQSAMLVLNPAIGTGKSREVESLTMPTGSGDVKLAISETRYRTYVSLERFIRSLVVTDRMYAQIAATQGAERIPLMGYMLDDDMAAGPLISGILAGWPEGTRMYSFYEYYRDTYKLMSIMMFVGVFVGLLFITATGSILYFRMSMEATEDREKFLTLIKLGIGRGQLKQAIAVELAIVFGAPLVLAIVNSFMASVPLGNMVGSNMTDIFFVIVAVYALMYGLYYLLTWNKYVRTVSR